MPELNATALRELQPVAELPDKRPEGGIGLCLSGGGYRAMLFHLGALWRLNEARCLRRLDRVSSVSGGSITAATLGMCWIELEWDPGGVATNLEDVLVARVRRLAGETIDVPSVLTAALPFTTVGERVAHAYREHLFDDATLQALPDDRAGEGPRFVICATNLESGVSFRFSRPYLADYRVGSVKEPEIPLADAVAASSAFPPVLSPFEIDLRDARWETEEGNELTSAEWRGKIKLSDGGVYDNLGLETVWRRCETVLISDGGGQAADDADPPSSWPRQTLRVLKVIDNQVRDLRKRQAVGSYKLGLRRGAYWGIRSKLANYELADPLEASEQATRKLAELPTRLKAVDPEVQERLVNWGFVICDAAVRRWLPDLDGARPERLPYPDAELT
jgi:NTE family protein